jgi:hypothetical protein
MSNRNPETGAGSKCQPAGRFAFSSELPDNYLKSHPATKQEAQLQRSSSPQQVAFSAQQKLFQFCPFV